MSPRKSEVDAVRAIGLRRTNTFDAAQEKVSLATLLRLFDLIMADGSSAAHVALSEVLCRLLEVALVRDPILELLVLRWTALSAQAPEIVRNRIKLLTGIDPPDETVAHLVNIVGGSASQHGRRSTPYETYLPELFARRATSHPRRELRCGCCGYHFTADDLNAVRRGYAENAGLVLAKSVDARRMTDTWKPNTVQLASNGQPKTKPVTGLTIDHIVPEEGLGWAGAENLDLLCAFCNTGKLAYRWALEPISMFGAGGFADVPAGRPLNRMGQTTVVSALMYSGGRCSKCGITKDDAELTAVPIKHSADELARGFAPWNLTVLCYPCTSI